MNPHPPCLVQQWPISQVPAAFPVGFALLTQAPHQYAAYYDADHRLTVAARRLGEDTWRYQVLPTSVGWDSHNYVTMATDDAGHLHVSGNMHCVPLIYFRTTVAGDIGSLQAVAAMTGMQEQVVTYPAFLRGADGALIFHYRDGSSGNGSEIYNQYDLATRTWRRLLDRPLTDGRGQMNAYMYGPVRGPDGWFHLCWVWRDTPDCRTNHDLSYARSRDLVHWGTIAGVPLTLPITLADTATLIDPVPVDAGLINGSQRVGFDSAGQVLASYHKFDEQGHTQAYVARHESDGWRSRVVSQWDYRWYFEGWGSVSNDIALGAVRVYAPGQLALPYRHVKYGSGLLLFDESTLTPLGSVPQPLTLPASLAAPTTSFPGLAVRQAADSGAGHVTGRRFVLRWETLSQNRDQRPANPHPPPSTLTLCELADE